MKMDIAKQAVWVASIDDKPGALAEKLQALAMAGVELNFSIARRNDTDDGQGVVYVTPIDGKKQRKAANEAGFHESTSLHALQITTKDRGGLAGIITQAIADAGVNLRGLSAAAIGKKAVINLAFDSEDDLKNARKALKKL